MLQIKDDLNIFIAEKYWDKENNITNDASKNVII